MTITRGRKVDVIEKDQHKRDRDASSAVCEDAAPQGGNHGEAYVMLSPLSMILPITLRSFDLIDTSSASSSTTFMYSSNP